MASFEGEIEGMSIDEFNAKVASDRRHFGDIVRLAAEINPEALGGGYGKPAVPVDELLERLDAEERAEGSN